MNKDNKIMAIEILDVSEKMPAKALKDLIIDSSNKKQAKSYIDE